VLGIFPDADYDRATVALNCGDRVVLFTDGLTEARNPDDEEFGEARLIAAAIEHRWCSAPAMQARLSDAVASFCGGGCLQDDATLIVLASDLG
jgi:sigma-B regulation protein RsbU (phosphoserine phosphatase)